MPENLILLADEFGRLTIENAIDKIATLPVEVPSWGFGRGGTRFAVYETGYEPSGAVDKIKAAGKFHELTGKGATVALHFPWDGSNKKDVRALRKPLRQARVRAGSINANLFTPRSRKPLDATLRFGSLTHPDPRVRAASVKHCINCIDYMRILDSDTFVLWLPDGTNSPGQMSMFDQADRLEESCREIIKSLSRDDKFLIEYKLFEPGFYSTAIQDYGRSLHLAWILGDNAKVLVDLGHHAHGVNVEQIIAHVVRQGKLGGFHFNDSFYADDDLATGSLHPHQMFRIFVNLIEGEKKGYTPVNDLALMIDQSHNVKDPFEELIESVDNIETAYARALMVDFDSLEKARDAADPSTADRILMNAFNADVRPVLRKARRSQGLPEDPFRAWREMS